MSGPISNNDDIKVLDAVFGPSLPSGFEVPPYMAVCAAVDLPEDSGADSAKAAVQNLIGHAVYNGLRTQPMGWSYTNGVLASYGLCSVEEKAA